jgi:hypothetical protein
MSIAKLLADLIDIKELAIPKRQRTHEQVTFAYGEPTDSRGQWLVHCSHRLRKPASTREIRQAEGKLGFRLPREYVRFLKVTNGAKLFCIPMRYDPKEIHTRHHLFGTRELVSMNRKLFRIFRECYKDDPEYCNVNAVNYLAFCDAYDGNYQSFLLEEQGRGKVFLLFREFLYRPYARGDAYFCYTIAPSFEEWLKLILQTRGWGGRGVLTSGL